MEGRYTTADCYFKVPDVSSGEKKTICMPVFDFEAHGHSSVRAGNCSSSDKKKKDSSLLIKSEKHERRSGKQVRQEKQIKKEKDRMFSRSVLILAVFLTFLITAVSMTVLFGTIAASAGEDGSVFKSDGIVYREITVEKGDTLWDIAKEWYGSTDDDIRTYIFNIEQMNHLRGDQVKEGQLLLIYCGEGEAEKLASGNQ